MYRYKSCNDSSSPPEPGPTPTKLKSSEFTIHQWKFKRAQKARHKDEFDHYISSATIDIDNPRLWWIQHQKDYPQLSKMALNILAIPAMSSEVERVFSSTGLMITDRRSRLKEDIIEAVECMKSWSADSGVVVFKDIDQVQALLDQLETKEVRDKDIAVD